MKIWTETVTRREGENMGPVDWSHPTAKDKPEHWREAEQHPQRFRFSGCGWGSFEIVAICMYDGWPYWQPRPAISYVGPTGRLEWEFFDGYGVRDTSLVRVEQKP